MGNESSISSNWGLGLGFSRGGGAPKKKKKLLLEWAMSPQSPATGAWDWASLGGGGAKKKKLVVQFQEHFFFFFGAPPPLEKPSPRPQLLEIED